MAADPTPALPQQEPYDTSASGGAPTWADRLAFQVWIVCFLLVLVVGLTYYLIGKLL